MPFDFSRFLHSVESRARTVHGLDVAARALILSSVGTIGAMVCIRLLRLPLPLWALPLFALPPLAAALSGYFVGRARHPRMPYVLLRIDDWLGLAARLSALYELRHRTTTSVFRARLESEVRDAIGGWREALPLGRRTVVGGSAGLCCVALSVGLAFVPLPEPQQTPFERLDAATIAEENERSTVADDALPASAGEVLAPATLVTAPDAPEGAGPGAVGTPERDQTLEDVFRDLSGFTPDEAVIVPLSPEDIEDLARVQGEAMRAVAQLLERIQDRLQDAGPSQEPPELTEEELADLQRELERGGIPPDLQEGLEELLEPPPSRTVEEIVEQLMQRFGDEEGSENESQQEGGAPQTTAVPSDQPGIEDAIDELSRPPDGSDSGAPGTGSGDTGQGPNGTGEDATESIGGPADAPGKRGIEDPDQVGGSEGGYSPPGERLEREPGFIREEETGKIGSEGEFVSEFVTEGVPIEVMPDPDGGPTTFRVRYDRIDAVLRERGLPEGAIDIVRDYFNAITEGET